MKPALPRRLRATYSGNKPTPTSKKRVAVVSRALQAAATRAGHTVDKHINRRPSGHQKYVGLADFVEGRTGSRCPRCGRLAQQRHRSAPRNLDQDYRCANIVNISETDDQLARGHRWFRSAGPAQPGFGGTLPYFTPKLRQTTILPASAVGPTPKGSLHVFNEFPIRSGRYADSVIIRFQRTRNRMTTILSQTLFCL
jgi:hypothetical protein